MEKFLTVREVAEKLNVPINVVHSWIETEIIKESEKGLLPWTQFVDNMSDELKKEMSILQQQVLARDED